ncbi:MAG: hypothetical protein ACOZB3_04175 [Calditrichota bacterium]
MNASYYRKVFLLLVAVVPLCSCTVIGTYVGARADKANRKNAHGTWQQPAMIPNHRQMEVILTNGDTLIGKSDTVGYLPDSVYDRALAEGLTPDQAFPAMHSPVSLKLKNGKQAQVRFDGFYPNMMTVTGKNEKHQFCVPWNTLDSLNGADGVHYSGESLEALANAQQIPFRQALRLQTADSLELLPLNSIREFHAQPSQTHYWALGMVAGMAVDGLMVYAISQAIESAMSNMMMGSFDMNMNLGGGGGY